jgi:hypothetical protein
VAEEPSEALVGECFLRDPAAPILGPQLVVDAAVGEEDGRGEREVEAGEGGPERQALGAVEIEERVVEIEEDGAEAGQGLVRAARGHFAR